MLSGFMRSCTKKAPTCEGAFPLSIYPGLKAYLPASSVVSSAFLAAYKFLSNNRFSEL